MGSWWFVKNWGGSIVHCTLMYSTVNTVGWLVENMEWNGFVRSSGLDVGRMVL